MSLISIFANKPALTFEGLSGDFQNAAYHFDAIARFNTDLSATYTSYPIEFGADLQDSAYNNPNKMTIFGYTGSRSLRISDFNNLPEVAASDLSGVIGNQGSALANVLGGIAGGAAASYLAGTDKTRAAATMNFLVSLKERFETFTVQTGLIILPGMKIDRLTTVTDRGNETGLEFICELSQRRVSGEEERRIGNVGNLSPNDPARNMGAPILNRGRVAFG